MYTGDGVSLISWSSFPCVSGGGVVTNLRTSDVHNVSLLSFCGLVTPDVRSQVRVSSTAFLSTAFMHMCLYHQAVQFGNSGRAVMLRNWNSKSSPSS